MKVAIISTAALPTPPSNYGGIEAIAYDVADVLGERGHEVTLIATQGSRKPEKVNLLTTVNPMTEAWQEQTAFQYYGAKLKDFDIVHDMSHSKYAGFYIFEQKKKGEKDFDKVKFIANTHTVNLSPLPMAKPNVTCLSSFHSSVIEKKFGVDTRYVYNGVNAMNYTFMKKKAKTDRFLFLGRPNPEKGCLKAIELCKKVDVPLDVIAGRLASEPIKYAVEVARLCKFGSKWVYHGEVDQKKKAYMLGRARAMIFPLQWDEPFGLTVVEAMISGTPVITYDRAAMSEIVVNGKTGFVCKNDAEMLDALKRVDEIDPEACRVHARENFSREKMTTNWEKLYQDILNGQEW